MIECCVSQISVYYFCRLRSKFSMLLFTFTTKKKKADKPIATQRHNTFFSLLISRSLYILLYKQNSKNIILLIDGLILNFLFVFFVCTCVWCAWKDVVRVSRCRELYFPLIHYYYYLTVIYFIFDFFWLGFPFTWICAFEKCVAKLLWFRETKTTQNWTVHCIGLYLIYEHPQITKFASRKRELATLPATTVTIECK